jgi:Golgi nucleoside diphosphatase
MFTSFEKNDTTSDSITFGDNLETIVKEMFLAMVKVLSQPNILSVKILLNLWTIICCSYHNFVR